MNMGNRLYHDKRPRESRLVPREHYCHRDGERGWKPKQGFENEASADNYIEAACAAAPRWRSVRVATSDAIEQTVTLGRGAVRISSREFLMELSQVRSAGRGRMKEERVSRGDILSRLPPHQRELFDKMRRGEE